MSRRGSSKRMLKVSKFLLATVPLTALIAVGGQAHAASDSFEGGGVLQDGLEALHQKFTRSGRPESEASLPKLQIVDQKSSTVGFTPRFAGVPIELAEGVSVDRGSVLKARVAGASQDTESRALKLAQTHDLGLFKVDLSAIAGFSKQSDEDYANAQTFGIGGGLEISSLGGLRFDAAYSRRDEFLGLARDSMTAGLGYDFGTLGTRVSVTNVSQYDINGVAADEQKVWSVGGQMKLSSSFVVGGDLAYSTSLDGTDDTSGVVNFRFNF